MIWAILALMGVPLWLCAVGILVLVLRNRSLRRRPGNVPVRVLPEGKQRWRRGHGVWVSDVFAWRGSPAAWQEELFPAVGARTCSPDREQRKRLRRLDHPVLAELTGGDGGTIRVASAAADELGLLGPFGVGRQVAAEDIR